MATTSSAMRQLTDANSPGTMFGLTSGDLIRFYGAFGSSTGVAQLSVVGAALTSQSTAAVLANQSTAATGSTWACSTRAQMDFIISTCVQLWQLGIVG